MLYIHERYLFAVLLLLPLGYARTKDRRLLWLCAGFSVTTFLNTAIVLDNAILFGATQGHLNTDTLGLNVAIGVANLLLYLYAMHIAFSSPKTIGEPAAPALPKQDRRASYRAALLKPKDARMRLNRRDYMAKRGDMVIAFGPLKPVGLVDPRTGKQPFAVVQLRRDNADGTLYNIVGFQTRLTFPEQRRVFGMIPGLENAEYARLGVMHRNTFLNSPGFLDETYQVRNRPGLYFAGQITGVEGYVESAASGLLAGM